ncbi:MAG TPA: DegT/DnrJ/EryC1/StrS family aminotransferase [Candidatus Merdimorpha stercoravium]|uniref:DegT/DnrJ/EryC1/StrS family aminotransferase n=1 Tax=Candidatus Merdimorpha stercoravium TaxID=2840863 RepID=A0A9D1KSX2_9FLAO|nr:DegT/DnrJ/EryC1/StrS family aminotransferase [Candidatus Merdimorpha stercoravium]
MKEIRMVDLKGQYEKIKEEVDAAVVSVMGSSAFVNGPEVSAFQQELEAYLGVKHVIPCGNGTDALQISLMALGLEKGDEVITADFTFAATVEVIALLGLKQVLVDVDRRTMTIDPAAVERAITPRTKAIIPVHLFGQTADMAPLLALAEKHHLAIVEDTAQAIGAEYIFPDGTAKKAGTIGTLGATSFFPSKNLGCYGDGGAIFTNDDQLAHRVRGIVNHGMYRRYYHDEIGVNSRLDSIQAAILRIKLRHLDQYNSARRAAAAMYDRALAGGGKVVTPYVAPYSRHVFHQYTLQLADGVDREGLIAHLNAKGIPAMIYYPVALRKQKAYDTHDYDDTQFPNSDFLVQRVVSLPMHTELDQQMVDYIAGAVLEYVK